MKSIESIDKTAKMIFSSDSIDYGVECSLSEEEILLESLGGVLIVQWLLISRYVTLAVC